jgi:hypothetical protein
VVLADVTALGAPITINALPHNSEEPEEAVLYDGPDKDHTHVHHDLTPEQQAMQKEILDEFSNVITTEDKIHYGSQNRQTI